MLQYSGNLTDLLHVCSDTSSPDQALATLVSDVKYGKYFDVAQLAVLVYDSCE